MSTEQCKMEASWKRPDELMKLQRLKQKKKQLAARLNQNNNNNNNNLGKLEINESDKAKLLEAKIAQKRKNPFAKSTDNDTKKLKPDVNMQEESLLGFVERIPTIEPHTLTPVPAQPAFVKETPTRPVPAKLVLKPFDAAEFSKLLHASSSIQADAEQAADVELEQQKYTRHLPMDWSLKTRVRFFSRSELPATVLKTSQMASGLTSFVRCIDQQQQAGESGLDISPATRFNQATYYWQHPHLPWLTLFPRNSKDNIGQIVGERERKALAEDWDYSFRGLFQLLRARQCPYFYLCANTFTVLFRAAGVGGRAEVHAMMSPSTRGMRSALRQEGIEFSMPLKRESALNKSGEAHNSDESNSLNISGEATEGGGNSNEGNAEKGVAADHDDDDEEEEEEWLESLGVDEKEIRKIQATHNRKIKAQEMLDDFSDISLLLMEGVECQGFFSFLLNAKSTISSVGRLAGVPPTLLAPVGFPKATMQHLSARSKKVRMDGVDYCSIEIKGIVMPTFMPYVCQMLGETKDTFSATMATSPVTLAFSKATQKLLEEPGGKTDEAQQEEDDAAGQVFGQENLSDCGLGAGVIESICRTGQYAVSLLERVCYDKEHGYAWS